MIINSFCNYNLDSGCSTENFPSFLYSLVEEMIQFGEDMREKAVHKHGYKRTRSKRLKRPRPASDNALRIGSSCKGGTHITAFKEIPYAKRSKRCAFCKRQKAAAICRSCGQSLCLKQPKFIPGGRNFPKNGPCCFQRFHGFDKFPH